MTKPAARIGDLTGDPVIHTGAILTGLPTVLIGGQPAARMGDLLDCPIIPPNAITQGFPMVLIGG